MGQIGNLTTVNCGVIKEIPQLGVAVEVLGPGYSTHRTNMVCLYAPEGMVKVEVVYDGTAFYVSRFRGYSELQHYWSRKYQVNWMLGNKKYKVIAEKAIQAYKIIFGV